eukprot:5251425-Pyramimonas_sp.AAC.1
MPGQWCNESWEIKTAIVQRFEGIAKFTFFVYCKGSHLKRLTRTAGPLPRTRAALVGTRKRAARASLQAILQCRPAQQQQQQQYRPHRRRTAKITPQRACVMSLNEQLYSDTIPDTIMRRLLA